MADRFFEMRAFQAVAETGRFTTAATALGVSQAFVSRTIAQLEARLGATLINRSTRRMSLTEEGGVFLERCKRVLADLEDAERAVASPHAEPTGTLRVSAAVAFGQDQIVPLLPKLMTRYPRLEVRLSLSDRFVDLIEANIDVAIRLGRLADSSLIARKIGNLNRIVVASPSYVALHGSPDCPDDLLAHNCLLWDEAHDHLNRWPFLVDGKASHVKVRGRLSANNGHSLYQLALQGFGIMRLAEHLALPAIHEGRLVPLLQSFQHRDATAIHALHVRTASTAPRVRAFVDFLVEEFCPRPPWVARSV